MTNENNITKSIVIPAAPAGPKAAPFSALFGEMLVAKGLLSREELVEALNEQREKGGRLGQVLLGLKSLSDREITDALAEHLEMECFHFDDMSEVDMDVARVLPESISQRFCLVAIGERDGKVVIAMADPLNVIAIDTIALKLNRDIKIVISSPGEITNAIEIIYHGSDIEEQRLRDLVDLEIDTERSRDDQQIEDITDYDPDVEQEASKAPVIRFVDLLLSHAIKSRASDIHIEPQEKSMNVRMRVDGMLRDMIPPARQMQAAIIARIKILSDMDIAERRLPQDGRFKVKAASRDIDIRVSSIPTIYGEKIVMRILDSTAVSHDIMKLGLDPRLLIEFKSILAQPHGIIIVTGPTGSGKSTTLYSVLNYLKDPTKNITTVEDPVEYRLDGINQIQMKPKIGLDFAFALRTILRQDPDIILLGEIRDKETVDIAIKASLTGHLVLSTFHTNDAPSAISRLNYMGIEPYLLASSLNLIVAQRLVRKICENCKEPVSLSDSVLKKLRVTPEQTRDAVFYKGKGCKACGDSGYLGRLAIFEFLVIDDEIRNSIVDGINEMRIREMARKKGYGGLFESGVTNALAGLTTPEEAFRVTYTEGVE